MHCVPNKCSVFPQRSRNVVCSPTIHEHNAFLGNSVFYEYYIERTQCAFHHPISFSTFFYSEFLLLQCKYLNGKMPKSYLSFIQRVASIQLLKCRFNNDMTFHFVVSKRMSVLIHLECEEFFFSTLMQPLMACWICNHLLSMPSTEGDGNFLPQRKVVMRFYVSYIGNEPSGTNTYQETYLPSSSGKIRCSYRRLELY